MDKRQFLKTSLGVAAGSMLPFGVGARTAQAGASTPQPDWSLGWKSINTDTLPPVALSLDGELPEALTGSLYRNGPALLERAGLRYRHWFDGDGMIQHYRIDGQRVTHEARFVQTQKYLEEQAAGRFLYSAAGTNIPDGEASANNDTGNVANISLLPWNSELLALWEGGSAYRIDPTTLQTLGRKDWRDDLRHMPFSAHPLRERDGTLWNFGSAPYAGRNGKLFVYKITPRDGMVAAQPVTLPMAGYIHSFAMTEKFLVFYFGPHRFTPGADTFVDSFRWAGSEASRVLLVDKNDLTSHRWFEAPAGFVFHCAHAYDEGRDVVAQMCLYPNADVMQTGMVELMAGTRGAHYPDYARARFAELRLDVQGGACRSTTTDLLMEFPGIDARFDDRSTSVFGVGHSDAENATFSDSLVSVNPQSGATSRFAFDPGHIVEEPLFVAAADNRKTSGWLVGTFLDLPAKQSGVYVFDADNLAAGPVAMARMQRSVPLGFHGCFVGAGQNT
ncbi:MAG: carotenoid oxygenase family protein [Pseudomonadota bacterium]